MKNIDSFNIAVAEVFGRCYEAFPLRVNITIIEIGDVIRETIDPDCNHDIDLRSEEYGIARESVNWLTQAGYLWCHQQSNTSFHQVTLSPKALEILNAVPNTLQVKESLGEQLSKGVKQIGRETAMEAVKLSLKAGASLLMTGSF